MEVRTTMRGLFGRSYLDLDRYLDIESLKNLDDEVIAGIVRSKKDVGFYGNGLARLESESKLRDFSEVMKQFPRIFKEHPSLQSRFREPEQLREYLAIKTKAITFGQIVSIREAISGDYDGISYANQCRTCSNAQYFPGLLKFIESLPMKEIGRVSIFLSPSGATGRIHTDGIPSQRKRLEHEFIWLSTNLDKKFFIYNSAEKKKDFVSSHSAYFNSMDPHGSDPMPYQTYSIRVDGFFTDDFSNSLKRDFLINNADTTHSAGV